MIAWTDEAILDCWGVAATSTVVWLSDVIYPAPVVAGDWEDELYKYRLLQEHKEECQQAFACPPRKIHKRSHRTQTFKDYRRACSR